MFNTLKEDISPGFPFSREAEESLIGSLIIDPLAIKTITIEADDFYIIRNRWIFEVMQNLHKNKMGIDIISIMEILNNQGHLEEIGGQPYLMTLVNKTPTSVHFETYASIIKDKAIRRRLLALANDMAKASYAENNVSESISEVKHRLTGIDRPEAFTSSSMKSMSDLYDQINAAYKDPKVIFGIPTGITDYDNATYGNHRGELVVISGQQKVGKTKLLVQMAYGMAKTIAGAFYSMEMKEESILRRQLSVLSRVQVHKLRSGKMDNEEYERAIKYIGEMQTDGLFISDNTNWTTTTLRSDLLRLMDDQEIGWFCIDYLGKLRDTYGKDDTERTKKIGEEIHNICLDLNLAGIVISTINKEGMRETIPSAKDLSGSGMLSFNADSIAFLVKDKSEKNVAKLVWDSMREGTGEVPSIKLIADPVFPIFHNYRKSKPNGEPEEKENFWNKN